MLVVKIEVAIFGEHWLFILLQTQLPALIDDNTELIVLFVATANELVTLTVVDVEKIVSVFTGILDQLWGEGPARVGGGCSNAERKYVCK